MQSNVIQDSPRWSKTVHGGTIHSKLFQGIPSCRKKVQGDPGPFKVV